MNILAISQYVNHNPGVDGQSGPGGVILGVILSALSAFALMCYICYTIGTFPDFTVDDATVKKGGREKWISADGPTRKPQMLGNSWNAKDE